jgi:hypothetical protein
MMVKLVQVSPFIAVALILIRMIRALRSRELMAGVPGDP